MDGVIGMLDNVDAQSSLLNLYLSLKFFDNASPPATPPSPHAPPPSPRPAKTKTNVLILSVSLFYLGFYQITTVDLVNGTICVKKFWSMCSYLIC